MPTINFAKMYDPEAMRAAPERTKQQLALAQSLLGSDTGAIYSPVAGAAKVAEKAFGGWLAKDALDQEKKAGDEAWGAVANSPLVQALISGASGGSGGGSAPGGLAPTSNILNPPADAPAPSFAAGQAGRTMTLPSDVSGAPGPSFGFSGSPMSLPPELSGMSGAVPPNMAVTPTNDERNRDLAIRTVLGEAANQDDVGKMAVAAVLRNRAASSGRSVADEALAKNQFEPWNTEESRNRLLSISPSSPEYQNAGALVDAVMSGKAQDPTGGATFFYAPKAQAALGRSKPSWDNGSGQMIGDHMFFKLPYGGAQPTQVASLDPSIGVPGGTPAPMPQPSPVGVPPTEATLRAEQQPAIDRDRAAAQGMPPQPAPAPMQTAQASPLARGLAPPPIPQNLPPQMAETVRQLIQIGNANPRARPFVMQQLGQIQQQAFDQQQAAAKAAREDYWKGQELGINRDRLTMDQNKPMTVGPEQDVIAPDGRVIRQGQRAPVTLAPGTTVYSPELQTGIYTAPSKSDVLSPEALAQKKELAVAGKPQTTIDMKSETAEAQKIGAGSGERANKTIEAAAGAQKTLYRLNDIEARLKNLSTGKTTPGKVTLGAWGKAIGVSDDVLKALGADPNMVGDAQAFQGITNRMVVDMIGSGGFPANNFSDADREFLMSTIPQLANDPRANKIIMEVARRGAQRDIEKAKAWNQFRKDNKGASFDDFDLSWSEKVAQQDILGDLRKQAEALTGPPVVDPGAPPAPAGVDAEVWKYMTPQERALWK